MVSNRIVFAAVVIGVMVLVGGFASYQLGASRANGKLGESIPIGGFVTINAYHADGKLFATWSGHNSLYQWAVSGIAQCMAGNSTSPEGFTTCSGMTPNVWISGEIPNSQAPPGLFAVATNSLLPSGCTTETNPPTCTGWQTTGTITFPAASTTISYPIVVERGGAAGANQDVPFDTVTISPNITVNAGDSLVITVTFSIT